MADEGGFQVERVKDEGAKVADQAVTAGDQLVELPGGGEILVVENYGRPRAVRAEVELEDVI